MGEEIFNDSSMRDDLEKFPDDPDILDAYVRRGGNFSSLVSAIAEVLSKILSIYTEIVRDSYLTIPRKSSFP